MLKKLYFRWFKWRTFKHAIKLGCAVNGDILYHKGKKYYINIFDNVLKEVD